MIKPSETKFWWIIALALILGFATGANAATYQYGTIPQNGTSYAIGQDVHGKMGVAGRFVFPEGVCIGTVNISAVSIYIKDDLTWGSPSNYITRLFNGDATRYNTTSPLSSGSWGTIATITVNAWNTFTLQYGANINPGNYYWVYTNATTTGTAFDYIQTDTGWGGRECSYSADYATETCGDGYQQVMYFSYDCNPTNTSTFTINEPLNQTYSFEDASYSFEYQNNIYGDAVGSGENESCGYWLNGALTWLGNQTNGTAIIGNISKFDLNEVNNFTAFCGNGTGYNNTNMVWFSYNDIFSFRVYDNVSSTQLENFTITFNNTTNTTAYTSIGEWLNVSYTGLPTGVVNLSITTDEGYVPTTFERSINSTERIYENFPLDPSGLNILTYDEETSDRLYFTAHIYNTTTELTYSNVLNVTEYYLNNTFPTGECIIDISTNNATHFERRYYATISNSSFYWLDAYLLNQSSNAIFVRFHIRNQLGNAVESASMNILKSIGGASRTIAQGKSDAAGDISTYLLLNAPYSIQVSHPDYASYYTAITPTNNDYTIVLGELTENPYLPFVIYNDVSWLFYPYSNAITEEMTNITLYVTSANSSLYCWGMNVSYNGTPLYWINVTGSPSGGVIYYNLNWSNATNYATSGNITVQGWFMVNPPGGFTRNLFGHQIEQSIISFHDIQEDFVNNSGMSVISFAIIWCLLALLGGAWVGTRSATAGLVFMVFILAMGALGGWMDIPTGTALGGWFGDETIVISGWFIVAFSVILALSVIFLKERWA